MISRLSETKILSKIYETAKKQTMIPGEMLKLNKSKESSKTCLLYC